MATLTKSTGTVTLTGTAEKVTLPAVYGWVWVKNMSDADMFAGLSADISEGADGVMTIPSGECGRIQTDGFNSFYLLGTGNALVVAQNYADCPFKVGGKGGESPDLSVYAKTADVPNIKVNSAVDADTVGGLAANEIATNPNLLINPNFKINQRGLNSYNTDWKYTVDRWTQFGGVVSPNSSGGINISKRDGADYFSCIQRTEILHSDCNGKSMTLSAKIDGEVLSGTIIRADAEQLFFNIGNSSDRFTISSYSNNDIKYILVQLYGGKSYNIEWVKLEYGSIATPFIPPDPASELLKCQRYFYKCMCNNIQGSIPSTCYMGSVRATVQLPTYMRTIPSLKIINAGYVYNDSGYISLENSGLFVYGMVGNYLTLKSANTVSINKDCVAATSDCDFEFDAEIY